MQEVSTRLPSVTRSQWDNPFLQVFNYDQRPLLQSLNFTNGQLITSYTFLSMCWIIHAGIMVNIHVGRSSVFYQVCIYPIPLRKVFITTTSGKANINNTGIMRTPGYQGIPMRTEGVLSEDIIAILVC